MSYYCVCGVPGVGKSSFAAALAAATRAELILEPPEAFPLVEAAIGGGRMAYANQLDFLLAKARDQLRLLVHGGDVVQELDVLATHRIWSPCLRELGDLTERQEEALDGIVGLLMGSPIRQPDVYVVLVAPLETVLGRIAARGRGFEVDGDGMARRLPPMVERVGALASELRGRCVVVDVGTASVGDYPALVRAVLADAACLRGA